MSVSDNSHFVEWQGQEEHYEVCTALDRLLIYLTQRGTAVTIPRLKHFFVRVH